MYLNTLNIDIQQCFVIKEKIVNHTIIYVINYNSY